MSDIDMEPPSPSYSYRAYEERMISRPTTPISLPPEPTSVCGKRRAAMTRLKNQETMIDGYQKFLTTFKHEKDEHGVHEQMKESLKETIAARDLLVSELRTMPPCLDQNCPDHTEIKFNKTQVEVVKPPQKKKKKKEEPQKITRMTLSSRAKPPDRPPQRQYLRPSRLIIPSMISNKTLISLLIIQQKSPPSNPHSQFT
ncbi:uncharacterized protein TNCV_2721351 [Trichonephila clavipes]|nr:uncharacterized protein TNCV_2721351 [Trichonephila clavipes]